MTNTFPTDASGQPLGGTVTRSVPGHHQAPPVYKGSATPDEVRAACAALLDNFAAASTVLPVASIAGPILDLIASTAFTDAGRRGDTMRRFMTDLHAELAHANECLQRARAAPAKPPSQRVALVG